MHLLVKLNKVVLENGWLQVSHNLKATMFTQSASIESYRETEISVEFLKSYLQNRAISICINHWKAVLFIQCTRENNN